MERHIFVLLVAVCLCPLAAATTTRHGRDTDEEEAATDPCSQREKCNNTDTLDFYARNCFCDDLCHTYGDCCKDAMMPARRTVGLH